VRVLRPYLFFPELSLSFLFELLLSDRPFTSTAIAAAGRATTLGATAEAGGSVTASVGDETPVATISTWVRNVEGLFGDPAKVAEKVIDLMKEDDVGALKSVPMENLEGPLTTAVGLPDALAIVAALKKEDPTWAAST